MFVSEHMKCVLQNQHTFEAASFSSFCFCSKESIDSGAALDMTVELQVAGAWRLSSLVTVSVARMGACGTER